MLQIALPNKGALSQEAVQLVKEAGYQCRRYGRELVVRDSKNDLEFIFLRPRDIAIYVSKGVLALGVTGRDLAVDSRASFSELLALRFGKSRFHYAVSAKSSLTPDQLGGCRIATSFPQVVADDLARRGLEAEVIRLDGAVEISIQLGVADAIADVVESGRTLYEAGLKTVGPPILESEAVLIAGAGNHELMKQDKVRSFVDRLNGILVAREYVMIEYDLPEDMLEKASMLTPGIESPTVSPLRKKGWVAVKCMVKNKEINEIMDQLVRINAKGVIVTEIRTCRI